MSVQTNRLKSEALRQSLFTDGVREFVIQGSSMAPTLRAGQKTSLKPLDGGELVRGRCYAFRDGSALVLHRYVAALGEQALFIGDNMLAPQLVPLHDIVGQLDDDSVERTAGSIHLINQLCLQLFRIRRFLITRLIVNRRSYHEKTVREA